MQTADSFLPFENNKTNKFEKYYRHYEIYNVDTIT